MPLMREHREREQVRSRFMTQQPRYNLQTYAGRKTRHTCPGCGKPHKFTRYLDTLNGDLLPSEFGRCDREVQCGYHLSPYDKGAKDRSYANEARESQPSTASTWQYRKPSLPPPAPLGIIPEEVVSRSMTGYQQNNFTRLLERLYGGTETDNLIRRFEIGTSNYWQNATIFYQRDEEGRVRAGQIKSFNEDGKTAKQVKLDGSEELCTSWVPYALQRSYKRKGQPLPEWVKPYLRREVAGSPCLYGLRQLQEATAWQPVAITESPKNAILATPYLPAFVWLAVGALSYLNAERLQPVKNRRIVLWPDASTNGRAYHLWAEKAAELRGQGYDITVSDYLETTCTEQQKAKGYDLADLIMDDWPGYPLSWNATI